MLPERDRTRGADATPLAGRARHDIWLEGGRRHGEEGDGGPRPRSDAFTAILFVTLVAIVGGCVLMYLDVSEYGDAKPPPTPSPTIPKLGEPAPVGPAAAPAAPAAPSAPPAVP